MIKSDKKNNSKPEIKMTATMKNITWHNTKISRTDREKLINQRGVCIWFTGLSGSGKSTLANEIELQLHEMGHFTYLLDGDNVRYRLNKDLSFSNEDRIENIRRISEVSNLFVDSGIIVLTAFISPFISDREKAREIVGNDRFIEVFVDCDISTCEERDPKGLYKKARSGEIKDFTGISSPYEAPLKSEVIVYNGNNTSVQTNAEKVINYLIENNFIELVNS